MRKCGFFLFLVLNAHAQKAEVSFSFFAKYATPGEGYYYNIYDSYRPDLKGLFEPSLSLGWRFKKWISVGYGVSYSNNSYWLANNNYTIYHGPYLTLHIPLTTKFNFILRNEMNFIHWSTKSSLPNETHSQLSLGYCLLPGISYSVLPSFQLQLFFLNRFDDFAFTMAPSYAFYHEFVYEVGGGIGFTYLLNFPNKKVNP